MAAFKFASRVRQSTDASFAGTGPVLLGTVPVTYIGVVAGIGDAKRSAFMVHDGDTKWELFIGTVVAGTPDQITRDTVIASSAGAPAKTDFDSGVKDCVCLGYGEFFPELNDNAPDQMLVVNPTGDGLALKPTFVADDRAFCPQAAPWLGWQIVTGYAQHAIKIVDSAPGQGGSLDFDTCFAAAHSVSTLNDGKTDPAPTNITVSSATTGLTVNSHALTLAQMPVHAHRQRGRNQLNNNVSGSWSNKGIGYGDTSSGSMEGVNTPNGAPTNMADDTADAGSGQAHPHGVTDPGHSHSKTDPGHFHALAPHAHTIALDVKVAGTLMVERIV